MKFAGVQLTAVAMTAAAILLKSSAAFVPRCQSQSTAMTTGPRSALLSPLYARRHEDDAGHESVPATTSSNPVATIVSKVALAGTIFCTSLAFAATTPPVQTALAATTFDISTGAIVINTSAKPGQSLLKAEVDAKDLVGSIFANRKALKQSVQRISTVLQEELNGPAWAPIVRQVLQTEKDVQPNVQVLPPNDYQQLVRDLASGRLNLIVNGELINLSIDETSTTDTDEVVIRAKGVKGSSSSSGMKVMQPAQMAAKTRLQQQFEAVEDFWNDDFLGGGGSAIQTTLGLRLTNGLVFGGGTLTAVVLSYVLSYAYYVQQQDNAAKEAEAKRQAMAAKKEAAAAAKKAQEEE